MGRKLKDLTGNIYGRLTVIELDKERNKIEKKRKDDGEIVKNKIYWKCRCNCGNNEILSISGTSLINGNSTSCGCYAKEKHIEIFSKQNEYEFLEDDIVKGWDTKHEKFFLIDKCDYDVVKEYCWYKGRHCNSRWVAKIKGENGYVYLHNLIMERIDKKYKNADCNLVIDHINNIFTTKKEDDNRRCNLRLVSQLENCKNKKTRSDNTSGKQGVYYHKNINRWIASINNNSKRIQKSFHTFDEAVNQRLEWEKEFGYIGD